MERLDAERLGERLGVEHAPRELAPILDQIEVLERRVNALPPSLAPVLDALAALGARIPPEVDLAPLRERLDGLAERLEGMARAGPPARADDLAPIAEGIERLHARLGPLAATLERLDGRPAPDLAPVLQALDALAAAVAELRVDPPEELGPEALAVLAAAMRSVLRRLDQEAEALAGLRARLEPGPAPARPKGTGLVVALGPNSDAQGALAVAGATPLSEATGMALLARLTALESRLDALLAPSGGDTGGDTGPDTGADGPETLPAADDLAGAAAAQGASPAPRDRRRSAAERGG
ncbi:MAG: hypothetical protein D6686_16785 [Alphaproteobacteria bacterium]|nr:MAG: hypothetical protein D6686_16785 [Alphaproteobacteria bacterium]